MRRIRLVFILIIFLVFMAGLAGCKNDDKKEAEPGPGETFEQYVKYWEEYKFNEMYEMLSDEVKAEISKEDFVGRYEKIYQDLEVKNVKVTFDNVMLEEGMEEDPQERATLTFTLSMDTIAGPINYSHEAVLTKGVPKVEGEETTWKVEWDHGFIFEGMRPEDKVRLQFEKPERGMILDRNGKVLATNSVVNEVGLVPQWMDGQEQEVKSQVSELLGMTVEEIDSYLNASWVQPNYFVPIKRILPEEEELAAKLSQLPGVQVRPTEEKSRIYPYGEAFSHLIGYVDEVTQEDIEKNVGYSAGDVIGRRGLEQLFEEKLRGEKGIYIYLEKPDGVKIDVVKKEVKNGETIQLTIDADMQTSLLESFNGMPGSAVAIDPKSGETLALVSSPAFDPNAYMYMSNSGRQKLADDPLKPLINRFYNSQVPGSTLKPLTASIALDAGTITPDTTRNIVGKSWQKDVTWGGYYVTRLTDPGRPVNLRDAIVFSDNIYFAQTALEMGSHTFIEGLKKFGFGEETAFTYPLQPSQVSNSGDLSNEILLADSSYGQGEVQVNIIHLAATFTAFINDGNMIKPILLKEETPGQIWKEKVMTEETAKIIKDYLREVVTDPMGTARVANIQDIPLAGKTGTAETAKLEQGTAGVDNGWFVAFNADKEDLLVVMTIENLRETRGPVVVEGVKRFFEKWR